VSGGQWRQPPPVVQILPRMEEGDVGETQRIVRFHSTGDITLPDLRGRSQSTEGGNDVGCASPPAVIDIRLSECGSACCLSALRW
jgi:hypothetical protein